MDTSVDFLYLSEEDMLKTGVCDMKGCIDTMQEMFSLMGKGDYRMGGPNGNEHGIIMTFPKTSGITGMPLDAPDRRIVAMPAYVGGDIHMCGIKCYGSNQNNRAKGLPRSTLMLTLIDPETGVPVAYMSANVLSAMRTGAVPGLGVRFLCRKNPKVVSIVGPGVMGKTALAAFLTEQPSIETVKVKGRRWKGIDEFVYYCKKNFPQVKNCVVCENYKEACSGADIICFGANNALKFEDNPYIKGEWLKPGALVISTSALLMDEDFLADTSKCRLVSDNYKMYEGWGTGRKYPTQKTVSTLIGMCFYDLVSTGKVSRDAVTNIGDIVNGKAEGRTSEDQIIVYAVGGMPTEDVAWGTKCVRAAKEMGIGQRLRLWTKPKFA